MKSSSCSSLPLVFSLVFSRKLAICNFLSIVFLLLVSVYAHGQAPTATASTTTLVLTAADSPVTAISSFQTVTLTATVVAGGAPVAPGTVNFCVSTQPSCYGAALIGTAQLTAAGKASISFRPSQGSHSYKAIFLGTTSSATSTSAVQTLTVNKPDAPKLPTQTSITSSGTTGNYTLAATVTGNGNEALSGDLNFIDLTHGDSILATESLTSPALSTGFMFLPAQTTPQTATPLATGDFNGDGILDMVSQLPSGGVGLQLGNGDLTFKAATATLPGGGPVAVGDFNSDGNLDLALIATGGVQIYLGDGTGKLTALGLGPALTVGPFAMSVVDLNHDGILDLVVQDSPTTHVFLGAGDGTFQVGPTFDVTGGVFADFGPQVTSMVTGDFNADGIPDIAVAWYEGYGNGLTQFPVTFLFGDGTGNFTPTVIYPNLDVGSSNPNSSLFGAFPNPMYLAALDINHDGKEDLVAAWSYVASDPGQHNSGTINLIDDGDGTITPSGLGGGPDSAANGNPIAITVMDLIGNGSDTIALERSEGTLDIGTGEPGQPPSIVYNNAPAFSLPDSFSGGFVPGDFDGDGVDEIAVSTNSATSIVGFQVSAGATASNIAVFPAGSGTHQVDASYAGDPVHTGSVSASTSLDSGIGIGATFSFSPGSVVFSSTLVGTTSAAQVVTVTNTGSAGASVSSYIFSGSNASQFSLSGKTCGASLGSGASCTLSIVFKPTAGGAASANLVATDSAAGSPQSVPLRGTGSTQPIIAFAPASLTFASTTVGATSAGQVLTVKNTTAFTMSVSSYTFGGANASEFSIQSKSCVTSLAANSSCTITIIFKPTLSGSASAMLIATDSAVGSPQSVAISGTGVVQPTVAFTPTSLTFPATNLGAVSASQVLTVSNTSTSPMAVSSYLFSGTNASEFSLISKTCGTSLAANASCTLTIAFKPTVSGAASANLLANDNGAGSPQSVALSGTGGPPPPVSFSPASLTFPVTHVGASSASQVLTVSNAGTFPMTVSSYLFSGSNASEFSLVSKTCGTSLAGKASCTLTIAFKPTVSGAASANLVATDSGAGSPQSVPLSGTGQ